MSRRYNRNIKSDNNRLRLTRLEDRVTPATMLALDPAGTSILRFNSATPSVLTLNQPISGLIGGENIRGIDFRPATGELFALGVSGTTGRIGTLNQVTGAFSQVGATFAVAGTDFGFDFNPTIDRIRLVSDGENNFAINPNDGVVTVQTNLNPGNPNVVGSAYTNNFPNSTITQLFAIDSGTNQLFQQNPASGTLSLIGNLGVDTSGAVGFDIVQNFTSFAALNVSGQSRLFSISLSTGAATDLGQISGATTVITGLAVQRFVWDGGSSASANWTDGANWVGDIAPSAGDDLVFPEGAAQIDTCNNNFANGTVFNSITFTGDNYDIDGNDIVLNAGILDTSTGIGINNNDIDLDINLANTQIWSVATAGHSLIIGGVISGGGGASLNKERVGATTGNTGTLVFDGTSANTYLGTTTVNGGVLRLSKIPGVTAIPDALVIGDGTGGIGADDVDVLTSDQIADTSNVTMNSSGFLESSFADETINALSMTGGRVNFDNFTLTVNATVTMTSSAAGDTAIVQGEINLVTGDVIVNDGPAAVDGFFNGLSIIQGTAGLTKSGAGTLVLSGANTYSGLTSVNNGILTIQNAGALGAGGVGNGTTVASGATLQLDGGITIADEPLTLNGVGFTPGGAAPLGAMNSTGGNNTWTGTITLGTDSTVGVEAGSVQNLQGLIDDGSAGAGFNLTKELTGTLILSAANTYRGTTFVNSGILTIQNGGALGGTSGGTTVSDGATLQLSGSFTVANEQLTLNGSGFGGTGALFAASGSTVWTGIIRLAGNTTMGTAAGSALELETDIGETTSSFGVTKVGPGTLTYSGNTSNTYTGLTQVNEGTLQLNKTNGAAATSDLVLVSGAAVQFLQDNQVSDSAFIAVNGGATLDLNDHVDSIRDLQSTGIILLGSGILTASDRVLFANANNIFSTRLDSAASFGRVVVTNGSVTLDGIVQIDNTFTPAGGTSFVLVDNGGTDPVNGSFSNFPEGTLQNFGGTTFTITYLGGDGNDVVLTAIATGQIAGTVFEDDNGNGFNNNDPGIDGITVQLDLGADGSIDQTTTTANGGTYSFTSLNAGTYRIRIVVPVTFVQTTANPADIALADGQTVNGVDFGLFQLLTVSGTKFEDLNGNGTRDSNDPGRSGVTINLQNLSTGATLSATTDANGNYTIANVGPGTFRAREVVPAGSVQTTLNPLDFETSSGANVSGINFGNFRLISVSGLKFNDRNGDGVRQPGEPGVPGVVMRLTQIGVGQTVQVTTQADGSFTFNGIGPGTFQLREVVPPNATQTTPNPANFTTSSGSNLTGFVFGNQFTIVTLLVTGADAGGGPHVKVYNADGTERFSFFAYDGAFTGGVRVATGDVNGDGFDDIITGAGAGGGSHVKVFNGQNLNLLQSFFAYPGFFGGVFVGSGDVNDDGFADVLTGAGAGGGPHVKAFSGANGAEIRSFFAYGAGFSGGVRVAGGDVNGDGRDDIVTGAGPGGGPHVKAFSGPNNTELLSFFAFAGNFTGGVFVAAGDVNGDGRDDIIAGSGEGHGPEVRIFNGQNAALLNSFFVYAPGFQGGVRVGAGDFNGDGRDDVITGAGPGGGPHVKVINPVTLDELESFFAYDGAFLGGVFVG